MWALAVSGNTVYAGGDFSQAGGQTANEVAVWNTQTQAWAPLGAGVDKAGFGAEVLALAIDGAGNLIAGNLGGYKRRRSSLVAMGFTRLPSCRQPTTPTRAMGSARG